MTTDGPAATLTALDVEHRRILFYDGECVLCNRSVRLTIRCDRHARLRHAALQGATAKELLGDLDERKRLAGVTFYDGGRVYQGWRAIVRVGGVLFPWTAWSYYVLRIPPISWLLDGIYWLIARYRYRLFGRHDSCPLPPPELRDRYIVD